MLYNDETKIQADLVDSKVLHSQGSLVSDLRWCPEGFNTQAVASIQPQISSLTTGITHRDFKLSRSFSETKTKTFGHSELEMSEVINPENGFSKDSGIKTELSAYEAMKRQCDQADKVGVDYRPHLYDSSRKEMLLVDSGSQVCTFPPEPGDQVDPSMSLRAVNGQKIKCYGTKQVDIKINRKTYSIQVIKSDVRCLILGWNFIRKHRLNLEWNDWGDER